MSSSLGHHGGFCSSTSTYRSPCWDYYSPPRAASLSDFLLFSHTSPPPPSKPAFVDADTRAALTYADLRRLTSAASTGLYAAGLRRGHLVLLVAPNSIHFPALALAVLSVGAVLSTANPLLAIPELQSQVDDSDPFLILADAELAPKLADALVPRRRLVAIGSFLDSLPDVRTHAVISPAAVGSEDPATVMYSSGTTGKSKGVVSTHGNLTAMAGALRHVWATRAAAEEVYGCVVPMSHMFGFSVFVCGAVASGATTVVIQRQRWRGVAEEVLAAVEAHRVTRLPAVPPLVVQMARSGVLAAPGYDLTSLREVICSGAPIGREQQQEFTQRYPGIRLSQCYGLTETSGPVTLCDGVSGRCHVSIGRLIPGVEAMILDVRTGRRLPPNSRGELCLKGPPIMHGYLRNQEATAVAIDGEGWLHTGDLCYIDKNDLVYIVDRMKELIKYKAYQVAPAELEEVLASHPDILDVAVTSYPNEDAGEIPMACIVRKAGSKLEEDDVFTFMKDKVAPYKKVRKIVFVEFIPRSPSGKILRRRLKDTSLLQQRVEISARL